jgi:hypothetical protein
MVYPLESPVRNCSKPTKMTATSRSSLRAHISKVDTHGEPPDRGGSDAPKIDALGALLKKLLPVRRLTRGSQGGRGRGTRSKDGARFPSLNDSIKQNKDRKDKAESKKTREALTDFLDAVSSDDEEAMGILSDDNDKPMPAITPWTQQTVSQQWTWRRTNVHRISIPRKSSLERMRTRRNRNG